MFSLLISELEVKIIEFSRKCDVIFMKPVNSVKVKQMFPEAEVHHSLYEMKRSPAQNIWDFMRNRSAAEEVEQWKRHFKKHSNIYSKNS